jgi:hypothetical protein
MGGAMITVNRMKKMTTLAKIVATEPPRDIPLRRKNSTPGFNPDAKNKDIKIKTIIWLVWAKARRRTNAINAPEVARNPK